MARYKVTSLERATGKSNPAAQLGTTLHYALEHFTEPAYLATREWGWDRLFEGYHLGWADTFVGEAPKGTWWDDGMQILQKWYNRRDIASDILDVEVLSREVKKTFMVPYWIDGVRQEMPCNYIMDRFDKLDDHVYRVVDYKSQRAPLSPEDLHSKIQPRLYALAAQILHPDAEEIWVQFDFLRYERVATLFTRAENTATWHHIMAELQRIIDTPLENPPEVLNEGCRYCPRRFTCNTLQSDIRSGGVFSLSIDQLSDLYYQLKGQQDAIKSTLEDVELAMLAHANQEDVLEFDTENHRIKVTSQRRRVVDRQKAALILGTELMAEYGRLNVGDMDLLRKDPRVSPAQASMLDTAISWVISDPGVKVMKKT